MTHRSGERSRFMDRIIHTLHDLGRRRSSKQVVDEPVQVQLPISKPFITIAPTSFTKFRYVWKEPNCSVCLDPYSNTKSRAFPFNCSHEICFPCFKEYVRHQTGDKENTKCVMCKAPLRSDWVNSSAHTLYCRAIGTTDGIFVPLINSNGKTPDIHIFTRQDTTQYQLAHGHVPDNSRLRNHIVETSVYHHTIIRIQSWTRMMFHHKQYLQKLNSVGRLQRFVHHVKYTSATHST